MYVSGNTDGKTKTNKSNYMKYRATAYKDPTLHVDQTKHKKESCCQNPFRYILNIILCRRV